VTCHFCRIECKRKGRDRKGTQRYQCRQCSKTFLEPQADHLDNFCRFRKSLRVTPAMEAKITDHVWSVRDLLEA